MWNCSYFAKKCSEAGPDRYLNNEDSVIFSDRDKGVPAFHNQFSKCHSCRCFCHIIRNTRVAIRRQKMLRNRRWTIMIHPDKFNTRNVLFAAKGIEMWEFCSCQVPVSSEWKARGYKWLEKGVPVHGHSTSNAQESMNGVLRRARNQAPYRFNNKVLEWIGQKIHERSKIASKCTDCALTPYCKGLWEEQVPIEWLDVRDS